MSGDKQADTSDRLDKRFMLLLGTRYLHILPDSAPIADQVEVFDEIAKDLLAIGEDFDDVTSYFGRMLKETADEYFREWQLNENGEFPACRTMSLLSDLTGEEIEHQDGEASVTMAEAGKALISAGVEVDVAVSIVSTGFADYLKDLLREWLDSQEDAALQDRCESVLRYLDA